MYPTPRLCPSCLMERVPDERIVKEGRKKYVVYYCRVCKHSDIERYEDKPRIKFWNGTRFIDEMNGYDSDSDMDKSDE